MCSKYSDIRIYSNIYWQIYSFVIIFDYSWEHYSVYCIMLLYYTIHSTVFCMVFWTHCTLYAALNTLLSWVHNNSSLVPGTGRESTMSSQLDIQMNSYPLNCTNQFLITLYWKVFHCVAQQKKKKIFIHCTELHCKVTKAIKGTNLLFKCPRLEKWLPGPTSTILDKLVFSLG